MKARTPPSAFPASRKGDARPPPEPAIRTPRQRAGRRVGATLPLDTYVRFKAYVARKGSTGEKEIVAAIEGLLGPDL